MIKVKERRFKRFMVKKKDKLLPIYSNDLLALYKDALEDMVFQFAYEFDNPPRIGTGGLSTLEHAFNILGWPDPKPTPERKCQYGRCQATAHCGTPTKKGYKRVCSKHFRLLNVG